jgi:hypothetical protein
MVTMNGVGGLTSGDVLVDDGRRQGWWLVDRVGDGTGRILAGPYADRTEAAWAAAEQGAAPGVRPEYGARRSDGVLSPRPSPQDRAWFEHLEEQLDRLPYGWDAGLADDDPLLTLVVELTAALFDAGLQLHDPILGTGGVCLAPEPVLGGVVVTWRQHDRAHADQAPAAEPAASVQQVMSHALAEVLALRSFTGDELAGSSGVVVRWRE